MQTVQRTADMAVLVSVTLLTMWSGWSKLLGNGHILEEPTRARRKALRSGSTSSSIPPGGGQRNNCDPFINMVANKTICS